MENDQQHLFDSPEQSIVQASAGKRFINYIVDIILFSVITVFVLLVWYIANPGSYVDTDDDLSYSLKDRIVYLLFYALFMSLQEALFKGKSLGKLITGTRAVNEDGSSISAKTALLRGLSRAVPFCQFSALGSPSYPWQDRWTRTYVIDEKLSNRE